jgi:predicted outer membrane lipoprotein
MSFCSKCGTAIRSDEKFCSNCGNPVANEQAASASAMTDGGEGTPKIQINISSISPHLQIIKNIYLGMIFKPLYTIKAAIGRLSIQTNLILGFLLSVLFGLINTMVLKQVLFRAESGISGIGNLFGGYISEIFSYIQIPYSQVFGYTLIGLIILAGLFSACLFLISKYIFKANIVFNQSLSIIIVSLIPLLNFSILSLILGFINSTLGQAISIFGIILLIICIYQGAKQILEGSDDSAAFMVALSCMVFYLIAFLCGKALIIAKIKSISSGFGIY